jgi:hypothetical protein
VAVHSGVTSRRGRVHRRRAANPSPIWLAAKTHTNNSIQPQVTVLPAPSLIVAFRRQNEIISLCKRASSQLEKRSPWEVSHYMLPFSYWLWLTVCKRQTNAILNKVMDLFHNEIISFCQWKATIRLAAGDGNLYSKVAHLFKAAWARKNWFCHVVPYSTHTCSMLLRFKCVNGVFM